MRHPDPTQATTLTTAMLPVTPRPHCTHEAAMERAMGTILDLREQLDKTTTQRDGFIEATMIERRLVEKRDETIAALRFSGQKVYDDAKAELAERDASVVSLRAALARAEGAAKDVFALRYTCSLAMDTAVYKLWLAMDGIPGTVVVPTAAIDPSPTAPPIIAPEGPTGEPTLVDWAKNVVFRHDHPQSFDKSDMTEAVHQLRCAIARHEHETASSAGFSRERSLVETGRALRKEVLKASLSGRPVDPDISIDFGCALAAYDPSPAETKP